ncbi:chlorophyll a/b-binding protein [Gloeobacter morelensis]|uniref:Chlorophyll A-B binding protein n=1 Tax=Gloeobacter morelensis MG652769 TaxID=2781736 RepID=A0ABY3PPU2_9CYAN|nr:chlorophyll a/b-binding protein [Gloeobacter morelensis]UFP95655.1 hypothetical protein ISF26_05280 [Gloeobacter morelensis MG652769]
MNNTNSTASEPKFGFTPYAELLNGRLAMIGFAAALVVELATGKGVLNFLGLV